MRTGIVLICLVILFIVKNSTGQDTMVQPQIFPSGISIEYGIGKYSVRDEYISKEQYSGSLPLYSVGWVRAHNKYVYKLDFTYRNSNQIKNNNVSTNITQFTLNQEFLYPLRTASLFKKDLYFWLGPSTEIFVYNNDQDIAVSGFDYAQSMAGMISLGINVDAIYPLKRKLSLESSLRLTVLSLGFRSVDSEEDDQSNVKPLFLISGLNASLDLGARYYLLNRLSLILAYKFEITSISAWEPLLSASNNLVIGLTVHI